MPEQTQPECYCEVQHEELTAGLREGITFCPLHAAAPDLLAELEAVNVTYSEEDGEWWLDLRSLNGKCGAFPIGSDMGPIARSAIEQWKAERDAAIKKAREGEPSND